MKINLVIVDYQNITRPQLILYNQMLEKITEMIYDLWVQGNYVQIDIITDNLLLEKKHFCEAGVNNITLAPDGYVYPCQAFYFSGEGRLSNIDDFSRDKCQDVLLLTMCQKCGANNCRKCGYLNGRCTDEPVVPFELHCVKTNLDQSASCNLLKKIKQAQLALPFDINREIRPSNDLDPLITLRGDSFVNGKISKWF
jgi:CXXX repeat peptide maturase